MQGASQLETTSGNQSATAQNEEATTENHNASAQNQNATAQTQKAATTEQGATPHNVVIHYSPQDSTPAVFCYLQVNLQTQQAAPPIALKHPLEDISKDCQLGIDSKLNIYSLTQGQLVRSLPYINKGAKMRLHVRFSDDCDHVVFVDKMDDTLHVVRMNQDGGCDVIASCFTHAPQMNFYDGLTLRQEGHVIVIRSGNNVIVLRLLTRGSQVNAQYESEAERALSLVPGSKYFILQQTFQFSLRHWRQLAMHCMLFCKLNA